MMNTTNSKYNNHAGKNEETIKKFQANLDNLAWWMNFAAKEKFGIPENQVHFQVNSFKDNICVFNKSLNKGGSPIFDKEELKSMYYMDCAYGCNKAMVFSLALVYVQLAMSKSAYYEAQGVDVNNIF